MKKLILVSAGLIALAELLMSQSIGFRNIAFVGSAKAPDAAAGESCTTTQETLSGSGGTFFTHFSAASLKYGATWFVPSGDYVVCSVKLSLSKNGSPTYNLRASIYSHSVANDSPDALIGTASDWVAASDIPATQTVVTFSNLSATVTSGAGVTNWVVIESDAVDAVNSMYLYTYDAPGLIRGVVKDSDASGVWALTRDDDKFKCTILGN